MASRIPSDDQICLLKRALVRRCEHFHIVPEGSAAQLAAEQIVELFNLGITDEWRLATATVSSPGGGRH
jgi:hypothetical protein